MGILDSIRGFLGLGQEEDTRPGGGIPEFIIPPDELIETQEFRRKFVSGLFYCGGIKRQYFAETYEQNSTVREDSLLNAIGDAFPNCSDIRDNFGYADDFVSGSEVGAIWPEIEVGEL